MKWPGHRFVLGLFAATIIVWLGVMSYVMHQAALPGTATGIMLSVFEPGTPAEEAFAAITRAGAKPIRQTAFGFIWVVDGSAAALQAEGAIGNYRELPISPEIAGCVAVVNDRVANAFGM